MLEEKRPPFSFKRLKEHLHTNFKTPHRGLAVLLLAFSVIAWPRVLLAGPGDGLGCAPACANEGEEEVGCRTPLSGCVDGTPSGTLCIEREGYRRSKLQPPNPECCFYCPAMIGPPFECGHVLDIERHDCHGLCEKVRSCMRSQCPPPPQMQTENATSVSITCSYGAASATLNWSCEPGKVVLGCDIPEPQSLDGGCSYTQNSIHGDDKCNPLSEGCTTCTGPLLYCQLEWMCNCSGGKVECGPPLSPTPTPISTNTPTATATPVGTVAPTPTPTSTPALRSVPVRLRE